MSIITLAEARQALNYTDDDVSDDAELQDYVDAITAAVEDYKNETIEQREYVEEREFEGLIKFYLYHIPVISLTSCVALDGWSYAPDVSQLHVTPETGRVRMLPTGFAPRGFVAITYQAGYAPADVPLRFKRGALVILQHVWETQRGAGMGGAGVTGPEEIRPQHVPGSTFSIPRKALEWLGAPRPVVPG